MYFVPESQKNAYLKEISSLAKAIHQTEALQKLQKITELSEVRHTLLDAISHALESVGPEARARMIQLEVRHAATEILAPTAHQLNELVHHLIPVSILAIPGSRSIVLAQDQALVKELESFDQLSTELMQHGFFERQGFSIVLRATEHFSPDRSLHNCLAVRIT
jgi:hypothetical protein